MTFNFIDDNNFYNIGVPVHHWPVLVLAVLILCVHSRYVSTILFFCCICACPIPTLNWGLISASNIHRVEQVITLSLAAGTVLIRRRKLACT